MYTPRSSMIRHMLFDLAHMQTGRSAGRDVQFRLLIYWILTQLNVQLI